MDPRTKRLFLPTVEMETRTKPKPGTFHVIVVERQ